MGGMKYADAGMDMKKWILWLMRKCWIVLAAAAIGALFGGVVYTIVRTVPESEREYQAFSKIYLDFATDETGQVYQEYNGYTWNDLMVTDPILDVTMSYLPEDYSKEEVMAATEATILSDLRLLTVTITTRHADRTDAILAATNRSLEAYGAGAKEFIEIETIQTTQAQLVVADSRLVQAVLIGAVIAFAAAMLGMLLYYVLDDRIFVASDVKQVTDVVFVGYTFQDEIQDVKSSDAGSRETEEECAEESGKKSGRLLLTKRRLQDDYDRSVAYLREGQKEVTEISVSQTEDVPSDLYAKARKADGVILKLPYGKLHGAYLSYLMEQYRVQGCKILGIAIENGDMRFLRRYYDRAVGGIRGIKEEL